MAGHGMTDQQRGAALVVLDEVMNERLRQHVRFGEQDLPDGTGALHWHSFLLTARETAESRFAASDGSFLVLLVEEVAEALCETDPGRLRAELVQVAAVAVQWAEAIDRRTRHAHGG